MPATSNENFFGSWPRRDSNGNTTTTMFSRTTPSTPRSTPFNSRHNSPQSLPSSPVNVSPISTSPLSTLRRNYSSTFTLIPEDRAIDDETPKQQSSNLNAFNTGTNQSIIIRAIIWWPLLLLTLARAILFTFIRILGNPFSVAGPTFWLSAFLWLFYKTVLFPLAFLNYIILTLHRPFGGERNRTKRTILISCGSTIQTLHLARNFYSAGARVIVFDFEGLFGLARFSTAVSKYYTIPKPGPDSPNEYITALCNIVEREAATYYVPVSVTNVAHYDALAKPHLELLGCTSFIPGTQEVSVLDDISEVMKKCRNNGITVPPHYVLTNKDDLARLYDNGWMAGYRNILTACGQYGILDRQKYVLPNTRREFRFPQEISENRPWIVIRDLPGTHYVTCTTIKESQVIANVTCSVRPDSRSLVPDENKDVEKWLVDFFTKVRLQRPINGHMSFRFVRCEQTKCILPIGTRVGVSLPYICHTGVHSRVLCKPCPHFVRQKSGPIVQKGGRYWIHEAVLNTLKHPSVDAVGKLIGTVLDKREALFVYWDPLPYCAYYHFQLPFKSVKTFLQRRTPTPGRHSPTLAAPVH